MNFFKSMERGLAWGIGRELAHGAARGARTTAAQRQVLAAIEQRKSLLASKYVTDQTVVTYIGDKVRFVDTSHGPGVLVEGANEDIGRGNKVKLRLPLAKGGYESKWGERLYMEVLPRPAGWRAPASVKSVILIKSPEWK